MISSSQLSLSIANDLDQNAYTTWQTGPKILDIINSSVNFVLAYQKRPWSLVSGEMILPASGTEFLFNTEIFYPYRAYLDEHKLGKTLLPIVTFLDENTKKFYVSDRLVRTSEPGLKLNMLYHRGHAHLLAFGTNDIDVPFTIYQAIVHVALWFIYPS